MTTFYLWRHPKPNAAKYRCIGQTDLTVNRRKSKRLANKISRFARRHHLPKVIWVSPLLRSRLVGECLAARGFVCHIDPRLMEIDFGDWDGKFWQNIDKAQIDAWCADFANFAPDNGENLTEFFARIEDFIASFDNEKSPETTSPKLIVGHSGWITAATMIANDQAVPTDAATWSKAVSYNELRVLKIK
ncbi:MULTISPECIES: histidine phosphatase family protein [Psychrobacter]|uniref:histidine phosphatase family protein n=1 Tax=Psychrobacter TaxID=497 RepID=UPI00146A6AE1|nr:MULTISPECIES: histidine phosphatase family protein [Psychrobacter]